MGYNLLHGTCLDKSLLDAEQVELTITSPPYNIGVEYSSNDDGRSYEEYLQFTHSWLQNVFYWTRDTGRLCLNIPLDKNKGGQKSVGADITKIAQDVGWKYQSTIIWNEGNISRRTAWGSFKSASAPYVIAPVELIVVLYKNEWKRKAQKVNDITKEEFVSWTNGIWSFNGESKKRIGHPAPFPRELPRRCLKLFSFVNDTILDPFAGSGTTILEAINNNRNSIGIEIDTGYIELAKERILKETLLC